MFINKFYIKYNTITIILPQAEFKGFMVDYSYYQRETANFI